MTELQWPKTEDTECEKNLVNQGRKIFGEQVVPRLKERHDGWLALIDLRSGAFVLSSRVHYGLRRLKMRAPNPLIWEGRISLSSEDGLKEVRLLEQEPKRSTRPLYPQ